MAEINSTNQVQVLDLSVLRKKRIQIDLGDGKEHILEINTTDMGVITRLSDGYHRLTELDDALTTLSEVSAIEDDDTDDTVQGKLKDFSDRIKDIDSKMREIIDYIFDTNASEVCCPNGSMYDPIVDGKLRYEIIIDALMTLYSDSVSAEMAKTKSRIKSHTAKYTKKKSKR